MSKSTESPIDLLLVRMDRIGDLVLNLPVDQAPEAQGLKVHWMITPGLGFLCELADPQRRHIEHSKKFSFFILFRLVRWLRRNRVRQSIVFHAPWWVSMALWLARIPKRGGRYSQWHSYLFYNHGLRQKRSLSEAHEADYNWQLMRHCLTHDDSNPQQEPEELPKGLYLKLSTPEKLETLKRLNLIPQNYTVVHPGMGGSALNWPPAHYALLIQKISSHRQVVVTGTRQDQNYLEHLESTVKGHPNVRRLVGDLTSQDLIAVLSGARAVVAPSTGVIHLAASTGTFSLGIYSNVPTESARRWGPKGLKTQTIEAPEGWEGELAMEKIHVDEVLRNLEGHL